MSEENENSESQEIKIEATGDAIIIADAINNLADAIRSHTKMMAPEVEEDDDPETYMDGSPVRK